MSHARGTFKWTHSYCLQTCYTTVNPEWEEAFTFFIHDPHKQDIDIQVTTASLWLKTVTLSSFTILTSFLILNFVPGEGRRPCADPGQPVHPSVTPHVQFPPLSGPVVPAGQFWICQSHLHQLSSQSKCQIHTSMQQVEGPVFRI